VPIPFRLYNTLTRQVEAFVPTTPDHVSMYVCGMTVYDHAHVGHARAFFIFDVFIRWLRANGWSVRFVRNYTDVDDKIIRRANQEGVEAMVIADRYIDSFREDCASLGLLPPDLEPRVSENIPEILAMVQKLVDGGHAYEADGSVWFSVRTYPEYGKLSHQDPDQLQSSGEGDGVKRETADFALWKGSKPGEPAWDSPWGPGRPGWHIECSAMNLAAIGTTIDIHGGGLDLVFPHHENEVAQSECANHTPYVRYWMHNGLLTLVKKTDEGTFQSAKMGKSLGNAFNIKDALRSYPAEALRLYYTTAHYRSPLPWSEDAIPEALAMLARLYEAREVAAAMGGEGDPDAVAKELGPDAIEALSLSRSFGARFDAAMAEDFNTAEAMGYAFELARAINRFGNHKKARSRGGPIGRLALAAVERLRTLGLLQLDGAAFQEEVKQKRLGAMGISREEVEQLIAARSAARAQKDWAAADRVREQLEALRILVMDRPDGVDWKVRLTDG
jgi:cysteinyl-tRNA synthetase